MYTKRNSDILLKGGKSADSWFPPETAFFVVGSPRWLGLSKERTCFEINTDWLMRALKGRDLAGKLQLDKEGKLLETGERLEHNLNGVLKNIS